MLQHAQCTQGFLPHTHTPPYTECWYHLAGSPKHSLSITHPPPMAYWGLPVLSTVRVQVSLAKWALNQCLALSTMPGDTLQTAQPVFQKPQRSNRHRYKRHSRMENGWQGHLWRKAAYWKVAKCIQQSMAALGQNVLVILITEKK